MCSSDLAFKEPKSKNAATTLFLLGAISMTMFAGITWLALKTQVKISRLVLRNQRESVNIAP